LLRAAQGYPCLILIPLTRIHHPFSGLGCFKKKSRVMNKEWNNSDWFEEWLELARNKGNKKIR
jgi:hypothetical protein